LPLLQVRGDALASLKTLADEIEQVATATEDEVRCRASAALAPGGSGGTAS
jgi:hypothetical protein